MKHDSSFLVDIGKRSSKVDINIEIWEACLLGIWAALLGLSVDVCHVEECGAHRPGAGEIAAGVGGGEELQPLLPGEEVDAGDGEGGAGHQRVEGGLPAEAEGRQQLDVVAVVAVDPRQARPPHLHQLVRAQLAGVGVAVVVEKSARNNRVRLMWW